MISHTNGQAVKEVFEYDSHRNLTKSIEAQGTPNERVNVFTYDAYGNLKSIFNPETNIGFTYEYDSNGNQTKITDPNGYSTVFTYNRLGQITTQTDPEGNSWIYTYAVNGNLKSITSPLNKAMTMEYGLNDKVVKFTDFAGRIGYYEYDTEDRLVKTLSQYGNDIELRYDLSGRLMSRTLPSGKMLQFIYNNFGNIITKKIGESRIWGYQYNDAGQLVEVTMPEGKTIKFAYNEYNELVNIDHDDFEKQLEYNAFGNLVQRQTSINGEIVTTEHFEFDLPGQLVYYTDGEGNKWLMEYDELGRKIAQVNPLNARFEFEYDSRDNQIKLRDSNGNETNYEYDSNNNLLSTTNSLGRTFTQEYDKANRLVSGIDFRNNRFSITYDPLSRIIKKVYFRDQSTDPQEFVEFSYDDRNRMTSSRNGEFVCYWAYDDEVHQVHETVNFGPFSKSQTLGYDDAGFLIAITDPDGLIRTYTYHDDGQLESIDIPQMGLLSFSKKDALGAVHTTYPNGMQISRSHDGLGRINRIEALSSENEIIMSEIYERNGTGNITDRLTEQGNYHYGYDMAGQLTTTDYPTLPSDSYTYDLMGNRITDSSGDIGVYDSLNQLTTKGNTTFSYDLSGNLTLASDGPQVSQYTYDLQNQLMEINLDEVDAHYGYDSLGRRLRKTVNGETTYYMYSETIGLIAEFDSLGNTLKKFGHHPKSFWGNNILWTNVDGTYYWHLNDQSGSPVKIVNSDESVVWSGEQNAFGMISSIPIEVLQNNIRFSSQYFDNESNLHYNRFRYYDPALGRYLNPDPIGTLGGFNLYSFATNDPINSFDPRGLTGLPTASDFNFQSGPWGARPDKACCEKSDVDNAISSTQANINRMYNGEGPEGTPVASNTSPIVFNSDRTEFQNDARPAGEFEVQWYNKPADPCVEFCASVHEWFHFTDYRWFPNVPEEDEAGSLRNLIGTELPAYEEGLSCLKSFGF